MYEKPCEIQNFSGEKKVQLEKRFEELKPHPVI